MIEFAAKIIGALVLSPLIKGAIRLCGHRVTWRLSLLLAAAAVFTA